MKIRKFRKGVQLNDLNIVAYAERSNIWLWYRHKAYHPSFIASMPFRLVVRMIQQGALFYAEINEDWHGKC